MPIANTTYTLMYCTIEQQTHYLPHFFYNIVLQQAESRLCTVFFVQITVYFPLTFRSSIYLVQGISSD